MVEARALRNHINNLDSQSLFLVCGTFSIIESRERAYLKIVKGPEDGYIKVVDPAECQGDWEGQKECAEFYTESTGTDSLFGSPGRGLSKRSDLILVSETLFMNSAIHYIEGSYKVFGNDGKHSGHAVDKMPNEAVSIETASALRGASSHLPVMIELGAFQKFPPKAPAKLRAKPLSDSQILLRWRDKSTNERGFKIERKDKEGNWKQVGRSKKDKTSYLNKKLEPGTTYYYRVYAFNSAGNSPYTNIAKARTRSLKTEGKIKISSTPTGAKVYLDSKDTGRTTNCILKRISPGAHTLLLKKENYKDWKKNVSVKPGKTTFITAKLEEIGGKVELSGVITKNGAPFPNVDVYLSWGNSMKTKTNNEGRFSFHINTAIHSGSTVNNIVTPSKKYFAFNPSNYTVGNVTKKGLNFTATTAQPGSKLNEIAKDFTAKDQNNKDVSLYDYFGKVILIDFSADWCGPCREEAARLESLYNQYKNKGFEIITCLIDGSPSAWANQYSLTFPVLNDNNRSIWNIYGEGYVPLNIILDRNGTIRYKKAGYDEKEIKRIIEKYL